MSRLACEALTVRRGGRAIVDGVSAALEPGTFTALVGANGSGKSTLLAALAGLIRPDAGTVTLDARPLASLGLKALARRRAYLPQQLRAEWPISVERLVALGLTPQLPAFGGLPGGFEPRLTNAIEACDLTAQRLQPATTLSGGELARAMLARALVGDPEILIADEPMTGLDPRHAMDTVARLQALAGQGRLVIAAVHDLTLAARSATHVMALREGRLAAFGPMAEVLTSDLLRRVFDVEARVTGVGHKTVVDFLAPSV
jgi:iron complex transport system ATP-binding protein